MNVFIRKGIVTIIITVIIGTLVLLLTPLAFIKGSLVDTAYSVCYASKGNAYIKGNREYYAARGSMSDWNTEYHADLELGDSVLVLCSISSIETAPTEIRIFYLWELW